MPNPVQTIHAIDLVGLVASGLVFATFYMKDMLSLRVVALFSNVAFLVYGTGLHLMPVLLLHGALIPMNAMRLWSVIRTRRREACAVSPVQIRSTVRRFCNCAVNKRRHEPVAPLGGLRSLKL
jgi:hypothetical protein